MTFLGVSWLGRTFKTPDNFAYDFVKILVAARHRIENLVRKQKIGPAEILDFSKS